MNNIILVSILLCMLFNGNTFKASQNVDSFRKRAASWSSASKSEKNQSSSWRSCLPNKKRSMSEDVVDQNIQKEGIFGKKIIIHQQDDEPCLLKITDKISLSQADLRSLRDELYKFGLPLTKANVIRLMNLDILSAYHEIKFPASIMVKKAKEERHASGCVETPTSLIPGNSARSIHATVQIKNKTYCTTDFIGRSVDTMFTILGTIELHKLL